MGHCEPAAPVSLQPKEVRAPGEGSGQLMRTEFTVFLFIGNMVRGYYKHEVKIIHTGLH